VELGNRSLGVILEHYSHREFVITNSYTDKYGVKHYALRFNDIGTNYKDKHIGVHLYYSVLDEIAVVEETGDHINAKS